MSLKYKVIDKMTGDDITNDRCWVVRPDGTLLYWDCDLIGFSRAEAVLILQSTVDQSIFEPQTPIKMREVTNPFG